MTNEIDLISDYCELVRTLSAVFLEGDRTTRRVISEFLEEFTEALRDELEAVKDVG